MSPLPISPHFKRSCVCLCVHIITINVLHKHRALVFPAKSIITFAKNMQNLMELEFWRAKFNASSTKLWVSSLGLPTLSTKGANPRVPGCTRTWLMTSSLQLGHRYQWRLRDHRQQVCAWVYFSAAKDFGKFFGYMYNLFFFWMIFLMLNLTKAFGNYKTGWFLLKGKHS